MKWLFRCMKQLRPSATEFSSTTISLSDRFRFQPEKSSLQKDYSIASVHRVLDILEYLSQQRLGVGLSEASRALGVPKSTLFRYLATLAARGYARKDPEHDAYSLGLKVLGLSRGNLAHANLIDVARRHMQSLLTRFEETVNLAVLDGNQVVYLEILESPHAFKLSYQVGGHDHAHTTSLGKSMLAFLDESQLADIARVTGLPAVTTKTINSLSRLKQELAEVRARGYAVDNEENEPGVCCVGATIFGDRGTPVAAISISSPAVRVDADKLREMGAAVAEAGGQISGHLGYRAGAVMDLGLRGGDTDRR
jgi:IclR family acetate operon transcriptional repressor